MEFITSAYHDNTKQDLLVSGTNIKTVNGESLLGNGNITIQDGEDGEDGEDGYSPVVTITNITGGHRVTITDTDHPQGQSFDILNGTNGTNGYTPVRGTDYWTSSDISQIQSYIDTQIGVIENGTY